ncbi:MAG: hypothetical protein AAF721_19895 [Myxococcota bacterium]
MDLETAIHSVVAKLVKSEGFTLPLHVASLAANGASLFTRIEAPPRGSPPGTVSSEHVTGDVPDDGFLAPIHLLVKDAAGRIRVVRQGPTGALRYYEFVQDDDAEA